MAKQKNKEPKVATPKLCEEIKALNGKSSRALNQCLDDLHAILDGSNETKDTDASTSAPTE